jgi:hypothetical protein
MIALAIGGGRLGESWEGEKNPSPKVFILVPGRRDSH